MKLILISGISGSGKSTLGKLVAEKLKYRYIDQDQFYIKDKPSITLSNGKLVKNWDCRESLDVDKLEKKLAKAENTVLTGFALRTDWIDFFRLAKVYEIMHIHLSIGDDPISKTLKSRSRSKSDNVEFLKTDSLMVREVVYPVYLQTLKMSNIDRVIEVWNGDERRSVDHILAEILSCID